MNDDYGWGVYTIGMYAHAQNLSQADVIAKYKARYGGPDAVAAIGKMARNLNVHVLEIKLIDLANDDPGNPDLSQADLNQILVDLGANLPPVSQIASQAVATTVDQVGQAATVAVSGVKYLSMAAIVLGACYLLFEGKTLVKAL